MGPQLSTSTELVQLSAHRMEMLSSLDQFDNFHIVLIMMYATKRRGKCQVVCDGF